MYLFILILVQVRLILLEEFIIVTPAGLKVPLNQIAILELANGVSSIKRKNRMRTINILADIDLSLTTSNNVISSLKDNILVKIKK